MATKEVKLDSALITKLFQLADEDKDGAIAGFEAVRFFARSGLSQDVLGQVRRPLRMRRPLLRGGSPHGPIA